MANYILGVGASSLFENGYTTQRTEYRECSPFARWKFTTDAPRIFIKGYCNIYSQYPTVAHLGLKINGAYQTLTCTADGINTFDVSMGNGSKTIEIIAGAQSKPSTTLLGTFPVAVYPYGSANAPSETAPSASNTIVMYGDSITSGSFADYPTSEAAAVLVRAAYGGSVLVEAWGYRALKDDGTDATARQTFSTRLASYNPSKIWLAIGTNDYGSSNGLWSAADFGTAYADLLDKLHTDISGATIYCQSPLIRTTETANLNHSNTLDDYRAQISTAAAARSGYCTYVNGKTILSTSDLTDGVHPSTAGHLLWANAIKSAMEV